MVVHCPIQDARHEQHSLYAVARSLDERTALGKRPAFFDLAQFHSQATRAQHGRNGLWCNC
jgi:hypothetical protein